MEILLFLLLSWTLTNILVNGTIFDPIRNWLIVKVNFVGKLLSCMACAGFWVGLLMYIIIIDENLITKFIFNNIWTDWISFGLASSGVSTIVNCILIFLIKK